MIEIGKGGWNEMLKFLLGYENLVKSFFFFFFLLNWVRPRGLDRPTIYLLGKGTAPPMTIDMLPCLVRQLIPVTRCRCIHRRCLSSRRLFLYSFHPTIHQIHYYTLSAMLMTIPPLTNILNPITWIVFDVAL